VCTTKHGLKLFLKKCRIDVLREKRGWQSGSVVHLLSKNKALSSTLSTTREIDREENESYQMPN
jgi:hypothetical protein